MLNRACPTPAKPPVRNLRKTITFCDPEEVLRLSAQQVTVAPTMFCILLLWAGRGRWRAQDGVGDGDFWSIITSTGDHCNVCNMFTGKGSSGESIMIF